MVDDKEIHRLIFLAEGVLNTLKKCISEIGNAIKEDTDLQETGTEIERLHKEILAIELAIKNGR